MEINIEQFRKLISTNEIKFKDLVCISAETLLKETVDKLNLEARVKELQETLRNKTEALKKAELEINRLTSINEKVIEERNFYFQSEYLQRKRANEVKNSYYTVKL